MQRLADELSIEQTAKRFIVSTDPDEHVEKIKTYLDLGFNHLVFHAPGPDQEKFLSLYGKEILPRLRALVDRHGQRHCVVRCAVPGTGSRWTRPRRRSCSARGATTSTICAPPRRGCATRGSPTPGVPASSRTRARSSSR